jgi:uncharacterized protein YndB with AHSA1/START domain
MATRKHCREMELSASPEKVFALLHTPSAIRGWWGSARAIVLAKEGGTWAAAWGDSEDSPDYITIARIAAFDAPRRMLLVDYRYHAKDGPLPFNADFATEFVVEARPSGCILRVTQDGFPTDSVADAFYAGCEVGWRNTFDGIRKYLGEKN